MSRTTDVERGARMAMIIAMHKISQPDLFPDGLQPAFWQAVANAAGDQLEELQAYRAAIGNYKIPPFGDYSDDECVTASSECVRVQ